MFIYPSWPTVTNLVANGGFETNTTGWTDVDGRGAITRVTDVALFGSASLYVEADNANFSGARYTVTMNAGTYTVSVYVLPDGTVQNWGFNIFNSTGTTTLLDQTAVEIPAGSSWVRKTGTFTVTGSAQNIQINFDVNKSAVANTDAAWIDGVMLNSGSTALPYVETDGGTATRSKGPVVSNISTPLVRPLAQVS